MAATIIATIKSETANSYVTLSESNDYFDTSPDSSTIFCDILPFPDLINFVVYESSGHFFARSFITEKIMSIISELISVEVSSLSKHDSVLL